MYHLQLQGWRLRSHSYCHHSPQSRSRSRSRSTKQKQIIMMVVVGSSRPQNLGDFFLSPNKSEVGEIPGSTLCRILVSGLTSPQPPSPQPKRNFWRCVWEAWDQTSFCFTVEHRIAQVCSCHYATSPRFQSMRLLLQSTAALQPVVSLGPSEGASTHH